MDNCIWNNKDIKEILNRWRCKLELDGESGEDRGGCVKIFMKRCQNSIKKATKKGGEHLMRRGDRQGEMML